MLLIARLRLASAESVSTTPPVTETSAQKHCPQTTRKKQENPMESQIWDVWGGGGEPSASFGGPRASCGRAVSVSQSPGCPFIPALAKKPKKATVVAKIGHQRAPGLDPHPWDAAPKIPWASSKWGRGGNAAEPAATCWWHEPSVLFGSLGKKM